MGLTLDELRNFYKDRCERINKVNTQPYHQAEYMHAYLFAWEAVHLLITALEEKIKQLENVYQPKLAWIFDYKECEWFVGDWRIGVVDTGEFEFVQVQSDYCWPRDFFGTYFPTLAKAQEYVEALILDHQIDVNRQAEEFKRAMLKQVEPTTIINADEFTIIEETGDAGN